MRSHLRELLTQAIEKAAKGGELNSTSTPPPLLLEPPKQREFVVSRAPTSRCYGRRKPKKPPRVIAEIILKNLEDPHGILSRVRRSRVRVF